MAKVSVNIKGLKEVRKLLGKEGERAILREVSEEMEIAAQDVRSRAVRRAPADTGLLRAGIDVAGKDLRWVIYTVAEYAGYVEFGTKSKVQVPPEMQEEAAKFRGGKSSYGEFRKAIAEWMRRKGIPEDALFPIMAKIMRVGVTPQPFMWPSFKEGTKNIEKDIDAVIQRYLDKQ